MTDRSDNSAHPKWVKAFEPAIRLTSTMVSWSPPHGHQRCPDAAHDARRAYRFRLTPTGSMADMTSGRTADCTRVGIFIRIRISVRTALEGQVTPEDVSINGYLERLVTADLAAPADDPFPVLATPTFAAKGKNGTGRPTRGARAAVMLRTAPAVKEQIRQRATSLHLTINDYLECLVSHDISAANLCAGKGVAIDWVA